MQQKVVSVGHISIGTSHVLDMLPYISDAVDAMAASPLLFTLLYQKRHYSSNSNSPIL